MKNRQLPFGYRVLQGQVVTDLSEAEAIHYIFIAYLQGASFLSIARTMSQKNLPYHAGESFWNKNMVKRILENKRYVGTDIYPAITGSDIFSEVTRLREGKSCGFKKESASVKAIRKSALCGLCGQSLHRDTKHHSVERWHCETEGCNFGPDITDIMLVDQVISLLNQAVQYPEEIEVSVAENKCHDLAITRLNNEINRELDKPDCDEGHAKALIMARAAAQYNLCADASPAIVAAGLREMFQQHGSANDLDIELFQNTIDNVIVQPDGSVSLRLKNGQILENTDKGGVLSCRQWNA